MHLNSEFFLLKKLEKKSICYFIWIYNSEVYKNIFLDYRFFWECLLSILSGRNHPYFMFPVNMEMIEVIYSHLVKRTLLHFLVLGCEMHVTFHLYAEELATSVLILSGNCILSWLARAWCCLAMAALDRCYMVKSSLSFRDDGRRYGGSNPEADLIASAWQSANDPCSRRPNRRNYFSRR